MTRRLWIRRPPHLVMLFLAATLFPAVALAWLGWTLLDQDRRLVRQQVQEIVDAAASNVVAALERELSAIDRDLGAVRLPELQASDAAVIIRLSKDGSATSTAGAPLLFAPASPPHRAPKDSVWSDAERLEYAADDRPGAIKLYRSLAQSVDDDVRAGALVRLARVLVEEGRGDEALAAYQTMAGLSDARVAGEPAELFARGAATDLLSRLGRNDSAADAARRLTADLIRGKWQVDRTTYLTYAAALRSTMPPADSVATAAALSEAVLSFWSDRQTTTAGTATANGRRSIRVGSDDVLVVWREVGDDLLLFAATTDHLAQRWQAFWTAGAVSIELVNDDNQFIAGKRLEPGASVASRPASETHLPWTVHAAAAATPADIAARGVMRRRIVTTALVILAFLIPSTGYLVVRAVNRELSLARQQAAFVSAVSHEFRSPLTSLIHLTSLLRSDFQPSAERRRQYYDTLAGETERLRRFVDTLLDFGRIQAGAARYQLTAVDPASIVGAVIEEFRRHAACGTHPVMLSADASLPPVAMDVEAFGRALWNLLENAAKYSPDHQPIAVRVERIDRRVAVRVTDRGAGIPPSEQPHIYEQFFRGRSASESAVKGTGVGLAVVEHIVQGHHGEIQLESTVGAGSTFTVLLPTIGQGAEPAARRVS